MSSVRGDVGDWTLIKRSLALHVRLSNPSQCATNNISLTTVNAMDSVIFCEAADTTSNNFSDVSSVWLAACMQPYGRS